MANGQRFTGTVKKYDPLKGHGWITPDGGCYWRDADIFVPATALIPAGLRTLKQGQRVTYLMEWRPGDTTPCSANVRLERVPATASDAGGCTWLSGWIAAPAAIIQVTE